MNNRTSALERVSVLASGAGPTGLLLAAELQRRGVSCTLVDARPGPLHWDRATVIHPRSLEAFESLGLIEQFLEAGTKQRTIKMYSQGQMLGALDLAECGSTYGFNLGLSEERTETILTKYLQTHGGTVHRSSQLVGLHPHPDGVLAEIESDGERRSVEAQWVVGCDGAHSLTRELSGIVLEGSDIIKPWAVFDATIQGWTDNFETNVVYFDKVPVIFTALPGRRWRVYLRPSSPESDLVADATTTLHGYEPEATFVDIANPTRFHCSDKVANRFRSGRILLAGDAAHLCSPAQGHGMNCGVQDAFNLAWKLALVCKDVADPKLLDSYEAERRPVAQMIAQSGDMVENSQLLSDSAEIAARDETVRTMLTEGVRRHNEAVAEAELNVAYSASPIVLGDSGGSLAPGQRLPNTIPMRANHTLVLLGGSTTRASELVDLHAALQTVVAESRVLDAAVAFGTNGDLPEGIEYLEPHSAAILGGDGITLLAVRPDGYVGMRSDRDHLRALERYTTLLTVGS